MEHLFLGLYHIILTFDSLLQRPLSKIVPDIEALFSDPDDYFKYQEITIGPWRRWGAAISWAMIFAFFAMLGRCGVFLAIAEAKPNGGKVLATLFLAMWIAAPIGGFIFGLVWLRGGYCILGPAGVRFVRGPTEVFCPWDLFAATGQAIVLPPGERNRIELPIVEAAVPKVEAKDHDQVVAYGLDVKLPQLRFRSAHELILPNLYQVKPQELAVLLLRLGRALGRTPSVTPSPRQEPASKLSVASEQKNGWLTVSLTRLRFPADCCDSEPPPLKRNASAPLTPLNR